MARIDLLTVGELKEYIKYIPDNVGCRIAEIKYDEKEDDFTAISSGPIHRVEYGDYDEDNGLLVFQTHYTREGVLGVDDGVYGLDNWK